MTITNKQVTAVSQLPSATTIESVLIKGDLSKLTEQQRTEYYMRLCQSIGLNPLTKPFQYLTLNNKLVLYAGRDCAEQLRKLNGISIEIVSQDYSNGLLSIHVRAKDKDGRQDEDLGVVSFPDTLKGDIAANTILKAVTKAKRRVTLSISGLGFLDETEVEDIPSEAKRENPHVTKPEDVIDAIECDEQGQPIDNIPLGDPSIERMTKAQARPEYNLMQTEIRNTVSVADLETWGKKNADRTETLPVDWQQFMRDCYRGQLEHLKAVEK